MLHEWEMSAKHWAQRCGVAKFEGWCADQPCQLEDGAGPEAVSYDVLSALYQDPSDLSVLPSDRLRMMARWGGRWCAVEVVVMARVMVAGCAAV